jgi:hypothetical protein
VRRRAGTGAERPGRFARLVEFLQLLRCDSRAWQLESSTLNPGCGAAAAETARGLLTHTVRLEGGSAVRYIIVALTEWNFHSAGPLFDTLDGRPVRDADRVHQALSVAVLVIEQPRGRAWRMPCAESVPLSSLIESCPRCGSHQLRVTGGSELKVCEIWIHWQAAEEGFVSKVMRLAEEPSVRCRTDAPVSAVVRTLDVSSSCTSGSSRRLFAPYARQSGLAQATHRIVGHRASCDRSLRQSTPRNTHSSDRPMRAALIVKAERAFEWVGLLGSYE